MDCRHDSAFLLEVETVTKELHPAGDVRDSRFVAVDLQPHPPFDNLRQVLQRPLSRTPTLHQNDDIVGIPHEPMPRRSNSLSNSSK